MSKIRILPDHVANQIAAGEVIERPAGVVKELLENSLDAGATRVEVEFRNGGKSYIRIEDNGKGMTPDEALLSLERHATSKITSAEDLAKVLSFGFRGEALPSIASVSRFQMRTRAAGASEGSEVLVNAGKIVHQHECGMPQGTRIEISHLFNSVPARRKFLKTDQTEAGHIIQLVRLYAVAHPEVSFLLIENGRKQFQSPVCPSLAERVGEIWGHSLAMDLQEIQPTERNGIKITGLLAKPGAGRNTRRFIMPFLNRRPIDSRILSYAIIEAYHTYLPKGRYPVACLFLDMPPETVDINVHPAKREVRFRDESSVRRAVLNAVLDHLQSHTQSSLPGHPTPPPAYAPSDREAVDMPLRPFAAVRPPDDAAKLARDLSPDKPAVKPATPAPTAKPTLQPPTPAQASSPPPSAANTEPPATRQSTDDWRLLGWLRHGPYALFDTPGGLIVLNVRAAHERILYEEINERFSSGSSTSQRLLIPIPLELPPITSSILENRLEFLANAGFDISPFGKNFFRIEAIPDWLDPGSAESFVRDLAELAREEGVDVSRLNMAYEQVARFAALRAVTSEERPADHALKDLIKRLLNTRQPMSCPRGKPTYFEISAAELERKFAR